MPQSLAAIYRHLVFSTKNRTPSLCDVGVRSDLHAYIGAISNEFRCSSLLVGGIDDHVHVLARLDRGITVADWVKELKRVSCLWLKKQEGVSTGFAWQNGYAAFSVSQSSVKRVIEYIDHQGEHHRKMGFEDELRALLRKHHVEFDEQYVWD